VSERKIKSVHITNYYHRHSGGISTSYNNLMAAAERHRRYVRLIVPGEVEETEDVNEFAKVYYVPAKQSPVFDKRYRVLMPWHYMPANSIIRRILLAEMPDMIEITDKYTLSFFGRMSRKKGFQEIGRPMLVHFSCERMDDNIGSFLSNGRFWQWFGRRVMSNYTLPSFDYHIANSDYTAEEFYDSLSHEKNSGRSANFLNWCWQYFAAPRVPVDQRIFVCPRGVNTSRYYPHQSAEVRRMMRERAGIPEDSTVLLYAGRISPEKNVGLLIDVMRELADDKGRDYRLLIAGAGPQAEWLKEEGESSFPGKMIMVGHLDRDTLSDYYSNADIFVHPNPKEPFGIAPLEAMASGVPTVAPNSGGILSYATNDNAWLVEPTGLAFAAAIREVMDNDELRESKVAHALETARTNTRETSTDRLFATYDRMWKDFNVRNELFTDIDGSKHFDFVNNVLNGHVAGSYTTTASD